MSPIESHLHYTDAAWQQVQDQLDTDAEQAKYGHPGSGLGKQLSTETHQHLRHLKTRRRRNR